MWDIAEIFPKQSAGHCSVLGSSFVKVERHRGGGSSGLQVSHSSGIAGELAANNGFPKKVS